MRGIWVVATLAGCAYRGGSFSAWGHDFAGQHATLGCVDVAIDRRPDGPLGAVLAYDLGNRCDHAVRVDLSSAAVLGRTATGNVELSPYDPLRELGPVWLDGRSVAKETIEYRSEEPLAARDVCVDAGSVIAERPYWQCFATAPEEQVR